MRKILKDGAAFFGFLTAFFGFVKILDETTGFLRPVTGFLLLPIARLVTPIGFEVAPKDLKTIPIGSRFSRRVGGTALLTEEHRIPFAVTELGKEEVYVRVNGGSYYMSVGSKLHLTGADWSIWLYSPDPKSIDRKSADSKNIEFSFEVRAEPTE